MCLLCFDARRPNDPHWVIRDRVRSGAPRAKIDSDLVRTQPAIASRKPALHDRAISYEVEYRT